MSCCARRVRASIRENLVIREMTGYTEWTIDPARGHRFGTYSHLAESAAALGRHTRSAAALPLSYSYDC